MADVAEPYESGFMPAKRIATKCGPQLHDPGPPETEHLAVPDDDVVVQNMPKSAPACLTFWVLSLSVGGVGSLVAWLRTMRAAWRSLPAPAGG
jgi:hypothetical protein